MQNNKGLTEFFEENSRKLFGYLLKMSASREDAEDIFQETFIKYARLYPNEQSLPLLFTVGKSLFLDNYRKYRYDTTTETDEIPGGKNPEDCLIEKRAENRLLRLMSMLTQEERELISLSGQDGLRYEEIAKIMKISLPNVKIKIHRTRLKLKKLTEAEDE